MEWCGAIPPEEAGSISLTWVVIVCCLAVIVVAALFVVSALLMRNSHDDREQDGSLEPQRFMD